MTISPSWGICPSSNEHRNRITISPEETTVPLKKISRSDEDQKYRERFSEATEGISVQHEQDESIWKSEGRESERLFHCSGKATSQNYVP